MESPISTSLGAMGPLLRKLDMLLLEPSKGLLRLHKGAKRATHLLKDDLEEITWYLEDLSVVEDPPLTAKCWMKEVRELSYDIENYIDCFVLPGHVANTKTRSGRRRRCGCRRFRLRHIKITRLMETNKKLNRRKRVAARISDFRIDAREALERHKRYELHCCAGIGHVLLPASGRLPATWEEGAGIIIDDRMRKFMDSMADDRDLQLKVVSVVGSEGIGKTTLVKVLYHKLKGQFDCRAFIRLTRKPDIKTVLRDILTQVQQQQPHNHCEDPDLLGKIREHLQHKRYLIVIDDLWSASIWDIISCALPGGKMCSRIIISTQIEDIALACCCYHSEYVFKMRPLDEDLSRELFFNSLFSPESDFPQKLKDVLNKTVQICCGFPLAITVIASLLATHPVILMEQWAYISDSLSSKLRTSSSASEGMKLVVNFSYNDLTCHLKTCLLYLSMYPEGHAVCKDDLVKQWVAEGFIDGTEGKEVETAESYFHELIGRRFLQPECIKYNGEIASCSVHAVVRDLIAQKSLEENFVVVLDHYRRNVSLSEKVHRLSLHFPHTKYAMANIRSSQVWSLTCFGLSKCMPSNREFKLLRVLNLNLSGHDDDDEDIIDLTWISELLRLRYLKVASDVCIELPKHMGGLQYLETVDISKKVTDVPSDIINLPRLLHLHLPFETNLMDWLDITGPDANVWSFGKLTNLQYLYLTCFIPVPDQLQRNILSILASLFRGLRSLKTLAFILSSDHKNAVAHGPSEATVTWDQDDFAPPLLERFEWLLHSCSFSGVPKWIGKLGNLCTLKISVRELMRDGVNILGQLPALTTLSLHVKIPPFEMIIFDKAGFSVLKYFKFKCSTVPWLKFEADAMPKLQKLKLGFSAHSHRVDQQSTVPISIEHLPGLKEISAKVADASSDAESALMAAVSNHPRNPRIRMQLVDWNSYGHRVWYAVSKQETPLTLAEDNIPHPEEGLDDQLFPQYKDSRDDQNKEAYVSSHLKRGPWTPEEDGKLLHYIQKNGHGSWSNLPRLAGLNRCGKSCRLRWINYLRPEIKHDNFSQEEEQIIIHLHSMLGNKWSAIAKHLPGRTDNGIKNFWNTHLRKRLIQMGLNPVTHHPRTYFSATLREQLGCGAATDQSGASTGVAIVQQVAELQYLQSLLQSTAATIPASSSAPSSNTEAAAAAAAALDHGTIFSPQLTAALDSSTITTASLSSSMDSAISQLYHSRSRPRRLSAVKKMKPNQQQQQGLSSQALPEVGDSGLRSSARDERRCAASTNRVEHAPG